MPTQTRATLKGYFTKGSIPTENNFADLIDSTLIQIDDGLLTSATAPLSIKAVGADEGLINFYRVESGQNPNTTTWQIKHLPVGSSTPGLSIGTPAATRLFIDNTTGNVGIGTVTPGFPLTVGNNNLGDKISLWGQSGNHYGFGIQGSQLQIHTAGASDDVVFGYGNSGSMTETMRIKGTGDVALLGKHALRASDTWLRLNQDGAFSSGVHTPGLLAPLSLNVGGAGGWGNPGGGNVWITGNVGIGTTAPVSRLDIFQAPRTDPGNHPTAVKGLYVTGDFGSASDGVEFRHSNGSQGIGFGFNSIYAAGSNANQDLNLMPKGTGKVGIGTGTPAEKLDVSGNIKFNNTLSTPGRMHITGEELLYLLHKQGVIIGKEWGGNGNLTVEGRVGIGTTTPVAPLQVSGGAALGSFFLGARVWPDVTGDANSDFNAVSAAWGGTTHSIVSDLRIRASALDVTNISNASDARTKRIVGRASGEKDLLTLMEIEVTDFTFIDTATNGRAPQKKVIAQQLEKVFSQAATRATGVVPDLFQRADIRDGWIDLATDLKAGERVRLIGEVESGVFEVLEVQPDRFRTGFRPDGERVFVYGREVKDFGSVDYDAIAMLNVSATQELARRVEAQAANMFAYSEKISTLEQRLAGIEAPVYEAVSHA